MSSMRLPGFALALPLLAVAAWAHGGTLYKCDTTDGSIAYTSSTKGYTNCKVVEVFPDPPKAQARPASVPATHAPPAPAVVVTPSAAPAANRSGWDYAENRADFANVGDGVAVSPTSAARADFRAVYAGVASSARSVEIMDFSTVLADVASTATTVGNPLFIAAPYRMRAGTRMPAPLLASATAAPSTLVPRVLRGAVYKLTRKDGTIEYTNIKPNGGAFAVLFTYIATCVACDLHSKIDFARTALHLDSYRNEIATAAADFGVDSALLHAVIHAESAFNPMAISQKGAQGLMQLMPGTASDMGVADAFDAQQNIRGGARYLGELLRTFNGDTTLATAAYNAGPGAVQKYGGVPPYDETRVYVQRVATLQQRYRAAAQGGAASPPRS
ncbi:MAG: lytic transglycosylase domain-containing protein [Dokdonella sp.]|uniref:lytic transglycosylase domain-containing protein n=1 Tax=Dokdonella sp. TaxID=2291710 RepID=UPI0025BA7812|nr:lytic transglycosylase domain-containing protein [Dokdonella sp.]MBZ0223117.1 lytic transglycosylase domain-containing protein [Dokdonella sp.]MCC7254989.1 lytic transglycosylase domain-containing protein [Dokdonella sp.]